MVTQKFARAERKVRFYLRLDQQGLESVEWEHFYFTHAALDEEEADRVLLAMRASAFNAWLQGAGTQGESLDSFLDRYHLGKEKHVLTADEKKRIIEKANKTADIINELYKQGKFTDGQM